jgi:hypothetical protein
MQRIITTFVTLALTATLLSAQDNDYQTTMKEIVSSIQTAAQGEDLTPQANQLERIAAVEQKEWLPLYWASFCYMLKSLTESNGAKKDIILEKAEALIGKADSIQAKNDEILVLKANLASIRIGVDPQGRWQKYGAISGAAITAAKAVNAENPRIVLHEAQGIFYTPEAFGGGKEKALPLIKTAIEKFEKFKPTSDLMPNWGKEVAQYMLIEAEKN